MMAEVQGQTEAMMAGVSAQLNHETQCFHDECSVARALRSDLALLASNQTRPASPASNQFRSPFGTPPKSVVASLGGNVFGAIPELPSFRTDDSAYEASSKISAARFKMTKFLQSLSLTQQAQPVQVGQPL